MTDLIRHIAAWLDLLLIPRGRGTHRRETPAPTTLPPYPPTPRRTALPRHRSPYGLDVHPLCGEATRLVRPYLTAGRTGSTEWKSPDGTVRPTPQRTPAPLVGPRGQTCYLIGDGEGPVSRTADVMESVQLSMGSELLTYARDMLAEPESITHELRFLAHRLTEALHDALRVAESRGRRLN